MLTQEQLDRPFDPSTGLRTSWAQDRVMQLDPRSDEFKRLLLKIAEGSDHPNDVAIARILRRELGEETGDGN